MKYGLVKLLFGLALLASAASAQGNESGSTGMRINLAAPKTLEQTDKLWLQVTIGDLTKGSEIEIWTMGGRFLGTISPFGPSSRDPRNVATYIVPIPRDAVNNNRLEIRLIVNGANKIERAPTKRDVRSIKLKVTSSSARRPQNHS